MTTVIIRGLTYTLNQLRDIYAENSASRMGGDDMKATVLALLDRVQELEQEAEGRTIDSPLIAALKGDGAERITQGYRRAFYEQEAARWVVLEHRPYAKKTNSVYIGESEAEAAKALAGE